MRSLVPSPTHLKTLGATRREEQQLKTQSRQWASTDARLRWSSARWPSWSSLPCPSSRALGPCARTTNAAEEWRDGGGRGVPRAEEPETELVPVRRREGGASLDNTRTWEAHGAGAWATRLVTSSMEILGTFVFNCWLSLSWTLFHRRPSDPMDQNQAPPDPVALRSQIQPSTTANGKVIEGNEER